MLSHPNLPPICIRAFVYDMIDRFRAFEGADFELHTDMTSDAWVDTGVTRKVQISGNLGLKLIHGLSQGLEQAISAR